MHAQKTAADIGLNPTVLFGNTVATALRNGTSKLRACTRVVAPSLSGNRAGTDSFKLIDLPLVKLIDGEEVEPSLLRVGPCRTSIPILTPGHCQCVCESRCCSTSSCSLLRYVSVQTVTAHTTASADHMFLACRPSRNAMCGA
jgi:hypothetical protein